MTTTTGLRTFDHSLATTQDWLVEKMAEFSHAVHSDENLMQVL